MVPDSKTRDTEERAEDRDVDEERQQSNKEGMASSSQKQDSVRGDRDLPDPASQRTDGAYGEMDGESVSETRPSGAPALDED